MFNIFLDTRASQGKDAVLSRTGGQSSLAALSLRSFLSRVFRLLY